MSGPNDSGAGDTPTGDLKFPTVDVGLSLPSPKFRLHLYFDTPRLVWRPALATPPAPRDQPAFLRLDDPFAAVLAFERYILDGSLLFSMRRPSFDVIDKAFLDAPLAPPALLPSFAQMRAQEEDAFYRRLGRSAPLFGAPAPTPLLTPPLIGPPPPSPFYKLPDPAAMRADPAAPKAGAVGDILKALHGLPIVQENLNKLSDEGLRQVRVLKTEWDKAPWLDRITAITIAAPLAAGVVGAAVGPSESRHLAFGALKGADVPVPWVPGLSFHVDDFGKADPFLLGKPTDPHQPQAMQFGLKLDVLKAIPAFAKVF
ncbi:MAG: hypothetical protein KGM15_06570 [Pseudomonadota bacterium]|nr:hypothetical protein [Pseudomonadota bacterium]